jgi:ribonuclease BN (tRNA processing enzyme)
LVIWLDAGSGTLANLQRHVGLDEVSAIVLSHEHPDHWSDLEGFIVARKYGDFDRTGPAVFAPAGLREHMQMNPDGVVSWVDVQEGEHVRIGGLRMTFSRTDHGPETLAIRFDGEGRSLGYSADSGPGWSLEALGPGLDLALCEATFLEDREGSMQHLSGRQAGRSAKAAGAARLMVTHAWPTIDPEAIAAEAAGAFGAPVLRAEVDMTVEV